MFVWMIAGVRVQLQFSSSLASLRTVVCVRPMTLCDLCTKRS